MSEGYSDTLYNTCHRNNWQNVRFPVDNPYVPTPEPTPDPEPVVDPELTLELQVNLQQEKVFE